MTRSQIEYILALEATRNFSRAADTCYVTQSTLSAMVAKFEQQVGVEVFDRKTKPIGITPAGQKILKSLKNIYREYQLLDEQVNAIHGKSTTLLGSVFAKDGKSFSPFVRLSPKGCDFRRNFRRNFV